MGRELGPVRMSGTYAWGIFGVGNWGLGEFEVRSFASRLVIFWVVIMNFISFLGGRWDILRRRPCGFLDSLCSGGLSYMVCGRLSHS